MRLKLGVWSTVVLLLVALAAPTYSGLREGAFKLKSYDMQGLREGNTAAFALGGRFVLVAPRESAAPLPEIITAKDLVDLTNNSLNIVDTKITKDEPEPPRTIGLGPAFFPTSVEVGDDVGDDQVAVVRATAIEQDPEQEGGVLSYEVMVAVHLHLADGKPMASGPPVRFNIPGENGGPINAAAPGDMQLFGRQLMFSTGRHVCVLDLDEGKLNSVEVISHAEFGERDYLGFGGFNKATRVLTVVRNMRSESIDGKVTHSSALLFYKLGEGGDLSLITTVNPSGFPGKDYFTPDSEVAILSTAADETVPQSAFFVTNNGNLCLVDFTAGLAVTESRKVGQIPSLAAQGGGDAGPRIVKFDPSTHTVFAFNPGPVPMNIRRPIFARPTRSSGIRRPIFARSSDPRTIVAAQLNSKSKIVSITDLSSPMAPDVSVSGVIQTVDGRWIFSASNGEVFAVVVADSGEAKVEKLGDIGHPGVEYVAYDADLNSFAAVCSSVTVEPNEDLSGAVVIAKFKDGKSSPVALSIAQMLSPSVSGLGGVITSIRRPCNLGR